MVSKVYHLVHYWYYNSLNVSPPSSYSTSFLHFSILLILTTSIIKKKNQIFNNHLSMLRVVYTFTSLQVK